MVVKPGTIVAPLMKFEQVQVSELEITRAASKVSAVKSSSMNVGLQSKYAAPQKDACLQQETCSGNDMPTHLKKQFDEIAQVC